MARHVKSWASALSSAALCFVAACSVLQPAAMAQEWPARQHIKVVVPYPPGGAVDVTARLIADQLSKTLQQNLVVENVSGAGGNIGAAAVARSAPDGYTILFTADPIASSAYFFKINYDPIKDFAPVIQLTRQPVVLAVHPSLGATSLADVVRIAKAQSDMTYATGGVGTSHHIVGEWFAKLAGIKLVHVPYRGGGPAINDLLAGHVRVGSLGSTPVIPLMKAGQLLALAQSGSKRAAFLPDVPTYIEAGYPDLALEQWIAAFVPAGTPPAIVEKLNAAVSKALSQPEVVSKLNEQGFEIVGGSSAHLTTMLATDIEKYRQLSKLIGFEQK